MKKLQPLDIVRTAYGTLCVVDETSGDGSVSLVLPLGSSQKYAWYKPSELVYVGSVKDICAQVPTLTQKKPKRETHKPIRVWNAEKNRTEDMFGNIADMLNGMGQGIWLTD